eukprot:scaffold26980_cov130-Amphora_coffeaeformis.AAC.5
MGKSNNASIAKATVAKKASSVKVTNKKNSSAGSTFEALKDAVFRTICEHFFMGFKEVSKIAVALEHGYTNPRSETILRIFKALQKEDGLTQNCAKKEHVTLTVKGENNIPSDLAFQPKSLKDLHEKYITLLMKKVKGGQNKIRPLCDLLMDGKEHSIEEVADRLGYKNPRSFLNTKLIQTMKEADLAEGGTGKVKLADKWFPAGYSI